MSQLNKKVSGKTVVSKVDFPDALYVGLPEGADQYHGVADLEEYQGEAGDAVAIYELKTVKTLKIGNSLI